VGARPTPPGSRAAQTAARPAPAIRTSPCAHAWSRSSSAAATDHIPQPLIDQLAPGGRLLLPVGEYDQELVVVEKHEEGTVSRRDVIPVRFVPMTGESQEH